MADRGAYGKGLYGVDFYSYDPFVYFGAAASARVSAGAVLVKWVEVNASGVVQVAVTKAALGTVPHLSTSAVAIKPTQMASLGRFRPYFALQRVNPAMTSDIIRVRSLSSQQALSLTSQANLQKWAVMRTALAAAVVNIKYPVVEVMRGWFTDPVGLKVTANKPDIRRYRGLWGGSLVDVNSRASFDVHAVRYMAANYALKCSAEAALGRLRPFGAEDTFINCFISRLDLFAGSFWLDDNPETAGWEPADIATTLWVDDTPKEGGWQSWPTHRLRITS